MHTEGHAPEPMDPDALAEMGYERRDVNIPAIRNWTIGFFLLTGVFFALGWIFYRWLAPVTFARAAKGDAPVTRRIPPAPNPLLQDNIGSKLDIETMRQEEDAVLGGYGWANKERTAVRIPIERAMEIVAAKGPEIVSGAAPLGTPAQPSPRNVIGSGPALKAPGTQSAGDTAPATPIPSENPRPAGPADAQNQSGTTPDGRSIGVPRGGDPRLADPAARPRESRPSGGKPGARRPASE